MMRNRRAAVATLAPLSAAAAAVLAAAPPASAADNTGGFHASWFRDLAETSSASSAATVTVPTVTCSGASGSVLRIEYGLTGRKIDQAAAALGRVTITCSGTTPAYAASIRVDYRDSGAGTFAVAPNDRLRVTSDTGSGGTVVTLRSERTGQSLRYSGPGLVVNGAKITAELRDAPRFSPMAYTDAVLNGTAFGSPRPTKWSQTDGNGKIIAEPTEFTDNGGATTIVDHR